MFRNVVLLATDGSLESRRAARMAIHLSEKLGLDLHVVHVEAVPGVYASSGELTISDLVDPDLQERLREGAEHEAREVLDEEVQRMGEAGGEVAGAHTRIGRADEEIVRLAEELDAGLVVLGSRGQGPVKRAVLGSVAESVAKHAHCPVLLTRVNENEKDI